MQERVVKYEKIERERVQSKTREGEQEEDRKRNRKWSKGGLLTCDAYL